MFFDITVANTGPTEVGFPRDFLQKRGPSVRLVDAKTKAETFLRTNPVDLSLADRFTKLAPGASAVVEWLIHPSELRQFGPEVDVSAEVRIDVTIEVGSKREPFARKATLHVTK